MNNFFRAAIPAAIVAVMSLISTPNDFAQAQGGPELVLTPDIGPCDATIQVRGSGYEAGGEVSVRVLKPHSEGPFATLALTAVDQGGRFTLDVSLGESGCAAAALDLDLDGPGEPRDIAISARTVSEGSGSKVKFYTYTTTMVGEGNASPTPQVASPTPAATADEEVGADGAPDEDTSSWLWIVGIGGVILLFGGLGAFAFIRSRQTREL